MVYERNFNIQNSNYVIKRKEEEEKKTFILLDKKRNDNLLNFDDWKLIINKNSFIGIDKEKIVKSIIKGIPTKLRGKIWIVISKSFNISKNFPDSFYKNLCSRKNEKLDNQIKKDIERTILFVEEESQKDFINTRKNELYNILKAYGQKDPEVGYAQGTNFIVLTLLSIVKSEEDAFWIFFQIMFDKSWRLLYINNTPKLNNLIEKLNREIKKRLPNLYGFMEEENVF